MIASNRSQRKGKQSQRTKDRRERLAWLERQVDQIILDFESYGRRQRYLDYEGEVSEGILLSVTESETLLEWWKEKRFQQRGRPKIEPSLFGNQYKEEFEHERQKVISRRGKERGATKEAIAILAARYHVQFDAMRKRIKGK